MGEGHGTCRTLYKATHPVSQPRPCPHASLAICQQARLNNFSVNATVLGAGGT